MSTAPTTDDVVQETARGLAEMIREVVRAEIENSGVSAGDGGGSLDVDALKQELREELRRDVIAAGGSSDAAPLNADQAESFFADEAVQREVNALIQEAFSGVLPTMVKRFRTEMENALTDREQNAGDPNTTAIVNSTEMKEMLEDRFRQMMLYMKTEVIPKAVKQNA